MTNKEYNLKKRTEKFGTSIILFVKSLPYNSINNPLISQLIRSSTSIGANYMEADSAESKKDFQHKIAICKKESSETIHWLNMVSVANPNFKDRISLLQKEVQELVLIFSSIIRSCNKVKS
ncbi:MAG: four helix bundle protein [Patescibacteria group bacterium]